MARRASASPRAVCGTLDRTRRHELHRVSPSELSGAVMPRALRTAHRQSRRRKGVCRQNGLRRTARGARGSSGGRAGSVTRPERSADGFVGADASADSSVGGHPRATLSCAPPVCRKTAQLRAFVDTKEAAVLPSAIFLDGNREPRSATCGRARSFSTSRAHDEVEEGSGAS